MAGRSTDRPGRAYVLPRQGQTPLVRRRESASVLDHALRNYDACRKGMVSLPALSTAASDADCMTPPLIGLLADQPDPPGQDVPVTCTSLEGLDTRRTGQSDAVPRPQWHPLRRCVTPASGATRETPQTAWWQRRATTPGAAMIELDSAYDCLRTETLGIIAKRQLEIDWLRERLHNLLLRNAATFAQQLQAHNEKRTMWHCYAALRRLVRRCWQRRCAEALLLSLRKGTLRVCWHQFQLFHQMHRKKRMRQVFGCVLARTTEHRLMVAYFRLLRQYRMLMGRRRSIQRVAESLQRVAETKLRRRFWAALSAWDGKAKQARRQDRRADMMLRTTHRGLLRVAYMRLKAYKTARRRRRHDHKVAQRLGKSFGVAMGKLESGIEGVGDKNPMWLCRPLHVLRNESFRRLRTWAQDIVQRRKVDFRRRRICAVLQRRMERDVKRAAFARLMRLVKRKRYLRRRMQSSETLARVNHLHELRCWWHCLKSRLRAKSNRYLRRLLGPLTNGPGGCETHEEAVRSCLEGDESQWRARCARLRRRIERPFGKLGSLGLSVAREVDGGVEVGTVVAGGPAEAAGVKVGDIVVAVTNPWRTCPVSNREELLRETGPQGNVFEGTAIQLEVRQRGTSAGAATDTVVLTIGPLGQGAREKRIHKIQELRGPLYGDGFNAEAVFNLEFDPAACMRLFKDAFDEVDASTHATGSLAPDEIKAVVAHIAEKMGVPEPAGDWESSISQETDIDQSGTLEFDEIFLFLRELFLGSMVSAASLRPAPMRCVSPTVSSPHGAKSPTVQSTLRSPDVGLAGRVGRRSRALSQASPRKAMQQT